MQCSEEGIKLFKQKQKINYTPSLIEFGILFTDDENNVSFPRWFNDSLIRRYNISQIERKHFHNIEDLESPENRRLVPREVKKYSFSSNGLLQNLIIKQYYDGKEISRFEFNYEENRDFFGYQELTFRHYFQKEIQDDNDEEYSNSEEIAYKIYSKAQLNPSYRSYQEIETGDYLFLVNNPKNYGALAIDSMLNPNPKDEIVLNSITSPLKRYQVTNINKESAVRIFEYHPNESRQLQKITKVDYPFTQKRYFIYNKNGKCVQYVDSLYSENLFVTRTISNVYYNKKKLPYKITHRKENQYGDTLVNSLETLKYIFNQ